MGACSFGCWVGRVCLFLLLLLLCDWMVGFVFGYLLNGFMLAGLYICIDTDLICYLISVFVTVYCADDCWLFRSSLVSLDLLLVH